MSTYTTTAPPTTATGFRTGRKKKASGPAALAKNEMKAPGMKMVDFRARSGERMAIARAKMRETFTRWGASMKLGVYTVTHPVHPIRRKAAKEASHQTKGAAAERRKQQVAAAHSVASAKRAAAREGRAATLNEGVH